MITGPCWCFWMDFQTNNVSSWTHVNGETDWCTFKYKSIFPSSPQTVHLAQCLANQVQLFYGTQRQETYRLVETFNHHPAEFKHMLVIAELEQSGLGSVAAPGGSWDGLKVVRNCVSTFSESFSSAPSMWMETLFENELKLNSWTGMVIVNSSGSRWKWCGDSLRNKCHCISPFRLDQRDFVSPAANAKSPYVWYLINHIKTVSLILKCSKLLTFCQIFYHLLQEKIFDV